MRSGRRRAGACDAGRRRRGTSRRRRRRPSRRLGRDAVRAAAHARAPEPHRRSVARSRRRSGRGDRRRKRRWPRSPGARPTRLLFPSSGSVRAIATYLAELRERRQTDRRGDGSGLGGRSGRSRLAARRRRGRSRHRLVRPHRHAFRSGAYDMNVAERLGLQSPARAAARERGDARAGARDARQPRRARAAAVRRRRERRRAADRIDARDLALSVDAAVREAPRARRCRRQSRAAVRHSGLQGCRTRPATTIPTASCSAPRARSRTRCRSCW